MTDRDGRGSLEIRGARPEEWRALGRMLGGAFHDDPIWAAPGGWKAGTTEM